MDIDITDKLKSPPRKREHLNRFSVSECWGIVNGYKTLKEFVEGKEVEPSQRYIMDMGTAKHGLIQEYLKDDYDMEVKVEKQFDEIVLSGRADMVATNEVLELKTSDKLITECKSWYEYQVKMYLTLLQKDKGLVLQPVIKKDRFILRVLGEVTRDDEWFNKQILLLKDYYKRVIKKYGNKTIL